MIFSSGSNFSQLNLFTTLCMKTRISNRAYSFPGHILGPPPNGTETSEDKVINGLPKGTLKRWGKSHHFTCNIPRIPHLLNVIPVKKPAIKINDRTNFTIVKISGSSARYLTTKVTAALAVSWPPISKPRILSAMSISVMNCPFSSEASNICDNISCVGDAFFSAKSIFLCLMIAFNSFFITFEALMARLKGVPDKSMGIERIPEAKTAKGSANLATCFGSSMLKNNLQANQKV
ncbi:hypothetical protein CFP56_032519 [Quercus suber]|uniref:Uncharacterized protein n=1 Tax=Quercus suber TaxID=58331 RepID=A0AAW0JGL5_QUESU